MLAYAANRPVAAARRPSPNAMLGIIVGHIALIALVMSAKMDLPRVIREGPIRVVLVPEKDPPPPVDPVRTRVPQRPVDSRIDRTDPVVPIQPTDTDFTVGDTPPVGPTQLAGVGGGTIPELPQVTQVPVKLGPQLATPASELKPPYPSSKIASEEEAVLKLRLTIDEKGRVVAVESLGRADAAFVNAARRHLLAHWRYKPATVNGRAVASSAVITLRFQLDG